MLDDRIVQTPDRDQDVQHPESKVDSYFSADVETDGPIPGPFSMLSFAMVYAGRFDGTRFERPLDYRQVLYKELRPISDQFQVEALRVNKLDRSRLCIEGESPENAMTEASRWVRDIAGLSSFPTATANSSTALKSDREPYQRIAKEHELEPI